MVEMQEEEEQMVNSSAENKPVLSDHCLVCFSDLTHTVSGISPCGHNDVCGLCHLRLRHLHNDKKCPMCKAENDKVIVDSPEKKKETFDEYPVWGNELGSDFVYRDDVGMFFTTQNYHDEILPLFGLHCTVKQCSYDGTLPDENIYEQQQHNNNNNKGQPKNKKKDKTPLRHLQDHLRNKHRLTLCQLCVDFKRDFVSLLPRFTPHQLKNHLSKGDGAGSGFKGHPLCEFCRPKRFYDLTQLHLHLRKEHYKCDVCEQQGRHNQYFRNYAALERHFDKEHFLCHDVQCLAARFVVFANEIDLRGHELSTHGGTSTGSTKIQLEFRVRRAGHDGTGVAQEVPTEEDFSYGLDGQAFVPEEIPSQEQGLASSHPLHVARTAEIRAQAERLREQSQQSQQEDAFPSLAGSAAESGASDGGLRMGWTTEGALRAKKKVGEVTADEFPSLPKANNKKKSVAAKIRAQPRTGASSTTAAAISAASWGGSSGPVSTSVAAPPSRPAVLSSSAFPPLSFGSGGATNSATASSVTARNREANLHPNNFPALGGGSTPRYAAADALAKKKRQEKKGVSLSNLNEFPPPPKASTASGNKALKQKMLGEQKGPSKEALDNVMKYPPPSSQDSLAAGKVTTEQMKVALGSSNYKRLKKLTKDFAFDEISQESYVDQAAALFDTGYADPDFWSFVPSLLATCPNERSSKQAIQYMKQLRISSGDRSIGPNNGTSLASSRPVAASYPVYNATLAQPKVSGNNRKKNNAWNSGGASSVARAKAQPGSVTASAVQQTPQSGTATKFMAREQKQQNQQATKQGGGNKKSQKKKERDELRALAFGK